MLWRYAYVACESDSKRNPRAVFERHLLKRAFERHFRNVLTDLDLHHPPCLALRGNSMFYAIAHNLLQALRLLWIGDEAQTWHNRAIIRNVLTVPATQVNHANRLRLKVCVPAGLLRWWRLFVENFIPKRKRDERHIENIALPPTG